MTKGPETWAFFLKNTPFLIFNKDIEEKRLLAYPSLPNKVL